MGNYLNSFNEQRKIRFKLSQAALSTLRSDIEIFNCKNISTAINLIFENYCSDAQSSIAEQCKNYKKSLIELLGAETEENIILKLLQKKREQLIDMVLENLSSCDSFLLYVSRHNTDYLMSNDCDESNIYEYRNFHEYENPSNYIRAVVEEYCRLPFIEREKIFLKEIYKQIYDACLINSNNNVKRLEDIACLKVVIPVGKYEKSFYVYPYKLLPDATHLHTYLTCYSRIFNSDSSERIASFNIARIKSVSRIRNTSAVSIRTKQREQLEKKLKSTSPAYLIEDIEENIEVELTQKGRSYYHSRLFQRPEMIDAPKYIKDSGHTINIFNCTPRQILNYFSTFGAEAKIISPEYLRSEMSDFYKKAYNSYNDI